MPDLKVILVLTVGLADRSGAAGSFFTPCTLYDSLLEAVTEAAKDATAGEAVSHSLACSSFDQFQNHQQREERFCQAMKSISGGRPDANPYMNGRKSDILNHHPNSGRTCAFSLRGFLRENHGANKIQELTSQKGRHSANFNE
jgi:hypothetical protein